MKITVKNGGVSVIPDCCEDPELDTTCRTTDGAARYQYLTCMNCGGEVAEITWKIPDVVPGDTG